MVASIKSTVLLLLPIIQTYLRSSCTLLCIYNFKSSNSHSFISNESMCLQRFENTLSSQTFRYHTCALWYVCMQLCIGTLHHDVVIINDTNFFYSFKIRYNVTSYLSTYLLLLGVSKSQFIQQKNSLAQLKKINLKSSISLS